MRVLIQAAALLALSACSGPLEVSSVTRESKEFERFPQIMQQFPVWQPIDVARYDFEVRDGARRPSGGLRYLSGQTDRDIAARFREQAKSLGCEVTEEAARRVQTICNGDPARGLGLYLEPADGDGSSVIILFIQTTPEFENVSF